MFQCSPISVEFSSVAQSYPALCNPINHSMPGLPIHHQLSVYSNSCPLSWWYHPTILSSVIPFSSCLQSFPAPGSQSNESVPHISWPKYWSFSFSISLSNEYSGLISFRMDWLYFPVVQGTLESLLQHHSQKHQFFGAQLYGPALTSLHDHWKNHSFD